MNTIYHLKNLSKREISEHFLKEASKACDNNSKLAWMNSYIQQGGFIPLKNEGGKPLNVSAILRENRTKTAHAYSLSPSTINEISQKTLNWIEKKKTIPGIAIDLGGGNSTLALMLLKKNWKVIVVDPSEQGLHLLSMRAHALGLGSIAKTNLILTAKKMEDYTFPSNIDFISAQDSLPYCDASKLVSVWDKIHHSLIEGGYFTASVFNNCSYDNPISDSEGELKRILDDSNPHPRKEILNRVSLGAWMTSPSIVYSLLQNSGYKVDYFSLDSVVIEFTGRK